MAEKSSKTSEITVLTLATMAQTADSDRCCTSDSPPLREKRAQSLASRQLTAGGFSRPTTLPLSRQPSSPEYDAPSPGLVSPTTPLVIEEPKGEHRGRSQSCTTPFKDDHQIAGVSSLVCLDLRILILFCFLRLPEN